jgi:pyruvate kinase
MVWGVYAVQVEDVRDVGEMIERACQTAISRRFAWAGCDIVVIAGLPFGHSGTTNLLHVARIPG